MVYQILHHIDGKPHKGCGRGRHTLYDPALGKAIGETLLADKATCDLAIAAAAKAWPSWAATTALKRASILFNFRELLKKNQQQLAALVTREQGKTLEDAKASLSRALELVEFHCGLLSQLQGSFSAEISPNIDCYTLRQPLGICVGISPFNFPIMVPVWMMIPAIACGNTFILKPSEQDPSASLRLVELLEEAGLPKAVVNCVQGDSSTVEHLISHPQVSACTAVASTPVAKSIYQTAIAQGKRAHTFGGAKNHCVVMPDADLPKAASAIAGAAFGSAGERCMALSVVVAVGKETGDTLLSELIPLIAKIRIGPGEKADTDMGPIISQTQRQRILAAVEQGIAEGASLIVDGRSFVHPQYPHGYYLGPSLFDQVNATMSIYQNEIFGPVLVMVRVNNLEEALYLVNNHPYGNGSAIFTRDGFTAREYSHRVQAGMVGINIPIPVPIASHPFGGWKGSVFGDIGMHAQESIHFYTRQKSIVSRWPENNWKAGSYSMPVHD